VGVSRWVETGKVGARVDGEQPEPESEQGQGQEQQTGDRKELGPMDRSWWALTRIDSMGKKGGLWSGGVPKYLHARFISKAPYLPLAGTVEGGLFPVAYRSERYLIELARTGIWVLDALYCIVVFAYLLRH
jgi:hypothetical protein